VRLSSSLPKKEALSAGQRRERENEVNKNRVKKNKGEDKKISKPANLRRSS
jgi:hypothetical protein